MLGTLCSLWILLWEVVLWVHAEPAVWLLDVVDQRLGGNNVSDQRPVTFPEFLGLGQLQDALDREGVTSCSFLGQASP